MGIYIHGVSMPKDGECIVVSSDGVASKYLAGDVAIYYDARPDEASAVELPPHGRFSIYDGVIVQNDAEPTIIPAEEGEI